jgi:hypothetical protein
MMDYEEINGEKYITIIKKVVSIEEASKGDYVEYNGEIYKFLGWSHGTYPLLEDSEGKEHEIYPYC